MNNKFLVILAVWLLTGPLAANADLVQSTTGVLTTFRQCVSGETACDAISPIAITSVGGRRGEPTAHASKTDPAYGTSEGSAQLTGAPGAAKLSASATSLPAARNGSNSVMLQRYTNTGADAETLTFGVTLSYDQTVPAENASFPADGGGHSGAGAEINIFTMDAVSFEVGTTAEDNYAAIFSEAEPAGYTDLMYASTGPVTNVTGSGTREASGTVILNPGDSIWLFAILQSFAVNGAEVDASLETSLESTPVAPANAHSDEQKEN